MLNWANTGISTIAPIAPDSVLTVASGSPPSLTVNGKIIQNGRDVEERIDTIEKVLMIPERDVILEQKYPRLKELYDQYIDELSKARTWETLKGNHDSK